MESEYLALRQQLAEIESRLEPALQAEKPGKIESMRAEIEAFRLKPEDLFSAEALGRPPEKRRKREPRPIRFRLDGNEWSGAGGRMPSFVRTALARGDKASSLLVPGASLPAGWTEAGPPGWVNK